VLRFIRTDGLTLPLFRVEKALREAGDAIRETLGVTIPVRDWGFLAKDGWVSTEPLPTVRLAASRFGELQLSLAIPAPQEEVLIDDKVTTLAKLPFMKVHDGALAFCKAMIALYRNLSSMVSVAGMVGGELREVKGVALQIKNMLEPMTPSAGVCLSPNISAGDFDTVSNLATATASCLCELAIQFRSARGGVGLSHQQLSTWLERAFARA
jgi:hypothetical protein